MTAPGREREVFVKSAGKSAFVLGSARIPFFKSQTSYLRVTRLELMTVALAGLVERHKLEGRLIGDTALGAVVNSVRDFNLAREAVLSTGLHPESPAYNVQRACGTGLETAWQIALKLHTGAISTGIAGGVDTNSDVPIEISTRLRDVILDLGRAPTLLAKANVLRGLRLGDLKPVIPNINEPRTGLSMGEHTEKMVKEWQISRAEQDELALASHRKAAKGYEAGFFDDLVVQFQGLTRDGIVRTDTSLEKLAKLKTAFDPSPAGTLTAGNSSPLTDGAACVLLANEDGAAELGVKPLARLVDVAVTAVDYVAGAGLLMAPAKAVAQLLQRNRLAFADFDYMEIHEAFAGQVLCTLKAWESEEYCRNTLKLSGALGKVDRKRLNVMGSSVAVGHPYAATGARITGTLAKLLARNGAKRGLISICTAGGMGIAAIMESA